MGTVKGGGVCYEEETASAKALGCNPGPARQPTTDYTEGGKERIVGEWVGTRQGRVLVRHGEEAETGQTKRDTA